MKILAVDIGTGTQDILLIDTRLSIENAYKLVLPAPTMVINKAIRQATKQRRAVFLSGVVMGGGPSQWATEAHIRSGLDFYSTPEAAKSFNDDLAIVEEMGVKIISEDESRGLPADIIFLRAQDFNYSSTHDLFESYGVDMSDLVAVGVSVFDHGAAPSGISDRQFRFDYLDQRIRTNNSLSTFAFTRENVPPIMTRLQAISVTNANLEAPLIVMDTAPAAVLGATFDPQVQVLRRAIIANIGNFHTLAFRIERGRIEGLFEHHTGLLSGLNLEALIFSLADGTLRHQDVFQSHGHGALIYSSTPLEVTNHPKNVVITGPRRSMMKLSRLPIHYASPFGDMMIAGCIGLVAAIADRVADLSEPIRHFLESSYGSDVPPWAV